jgi:hypothetical protein
MLFGEGRQINLTRDDVANITLASDVYLYPVRVYREQYMIDVHTHKGSKFTLVAPLGTTTDDMAELGIGMVN